MSNKSLETKPPGWKTQSRNNQLAHILRLVDRDEHHTILPAKYGPLEKVLLWSVSLPSHALLALALAPLTAAAMYIHRDEIRGENRGIKGMFGFVLGPVVFCQDRLTPIEFAMLLIKKSGPEKAVLKLEFKIKMLEMTVRKLELDIMDLKQINQTALEIGSVSMQVIQVNLTILNLKMKLEEDLKQFEQTMVKLTIRLEIEKLKLKL